MEEAKSTDIIKCPNCNASMRYSIADNGLKCEHCGQIEKIEGGNNNVVRRELTDSVMREHEPWSDNIVFRCNLCGAYIDVDKHEIMKMCPFCGNPTIIKTEEIPGIKPDSLIPYTVTKQSALELFRKWIHSKIYAPGKCRKYATADNINSIFSPVWSFTASTSNH
jgi:Zn finger protein HypA/HybF involved in hydrogenase expression